MEVEYGQLDEIVVIVKPACVQCNATYKALDKLGTEHVGSEFTYEVIDASQDAEVRDFVLKLGYLQLPVIIVGRNGRPDEHWSGFRPDRIKNIFNSCALYAA